MENQNSFKIKTGIESQDNKQSPIHVLVPVEFTSNTHAMEHAARVARKQNGFIHLYYITDLIHLPEFENPFALSLWLREIRSEAKARLKSFTTIIEKLGAKVFSTESSIGDASFLLQQKVESLIPNMIIISQESLRGNLLTKIMRNAPCPVVIVPRAIYERPEMATIYINLNQRRVKIDLPDLLHNYSTEKWSLN